MTSAASHTQLPNTTKQLSELFPQTDTVKDRVHQLHLTKDVHHDPLHTYWVQDASAGLHLTYTHLCHIRDWIVDIRQQHTPPTSYDLYQRSTKTIVDLNSSLGWFTTCVARKPDRFTSIIANDAYVPTYPTTSPYFPLLQQNLQLYNNTHVTPTNQELISFFTETYVPHASNAIVYLDVTLPCTPMLSPLYSDTDELVDYTIDTQYANDPKSLTEFAEHLLTGQVFQSTSSTCICPMLILRIPRTMSLQRLQQLNVREFIECKKLEKLIKAQELHYRIVALVGWKDLQRIKQQQQASAVISNGADDAAESNGHTVSTLSQRWNQYNSDIYVPPASEGQLRTIVALHNQLDHPHFHLWLRLKQIIAGRMYNCPQSLQGITQHLIEMCNGSKTNDEYLYTQLSTYFEQTVKTSSEWLEQEQRNDKATGRANSRVVEILELVGRTPPRGWQQVTAPQGIVIQNVLDIGCSEGSITAAVGEGLQLQVENIHGCDVREISDTKGFTFRLMTNPNRLPYADSSFTLVTCLMSFHHMDDLPKLLREIHRVLHPNGLLIFREHDLQPDDLALVLDVQHGLYARTWAIEQPTFCDNYTAQYANREYWHYALVAAQLYPCTWSPDWYSSVMQPPRRCYADTKIKNPFNQYYGVYSKHQMPQPPPPQQQSYNGDGRGRGGGRGRGQYEYRGGGGGRGGGGRGGYQQPRPDEQRHAGNWRPRDEPESTSSGRRPADTSADDDIPADFDAKEVTAQKRFNAADYGLEPLPKQPKR